MSLIDDFKVECTILERRRVPDGEGGWTTSWENGMAFQAAIVLDNSIAARIAGKDGLSNTYNVTVDRNLPLEFHDAFKRNSDGQTFRVTSNADDRMAPDVSTFDFQTVTAEEWVPA